MKEQALKNIIENQIIMMKVLAEMSTNPQYREKLHHQIGYSQVACEFLTPNQTEDEK
jgi:hypothetical protein